MADDTDDAEKTEEASQKKLEQARERGDVVKSQEVSTWFGLLAATLIIFILAGPASNDLAVYLRGVIANADQVSVDGGGLQKLYSGLLMMVAGVLALPFLAVIVAGIVGNVIQHGFLLTVEPIKPKFSKISPIAGFKRLFSSQSLVNFAKGLFKLGIVGFVIWLVIWPDRFQLETLVAGEPAAILALTHWLAVKLLFASLAVMAVIAGLDFLYVRMTYMKRQMMTMREIKEEYKQAEGDPMVKAKLRQIRAERGRQRMMQNLESASVVITNPTHYAVALKYENGMAAPICLAKGVDALALKIRERAKELGIPVIEEPPLARALHASVDLDREIDPQYYQAVAKIIGFVMGQGQKRRR